MNVIFDIDGTLADGRAFDFLLDTKPKLWDEWNRKTPEHAPWQPIVNLARDHRRASDSIYYITARAANCRLYTENWLAKHRLDTIHSGLYMRAAGDHRPDFIIKEEIILFLKDQAGIIFDIAYDDRIEVIEMYRRNGIKAHHVANGLILP